MSACSAQKRPAQQVACPDISTSKHQQYKAKAFSQKGHEMKHVAQQNLELQYAESKPYDAIGGSEYEPFVQLQKVDYIKAEVPQELFYSQEMNAGLNEGDDISVLEQVLWVFAGIGISLLSIYLAGTIAPISLLVVVPALVIYPIIGILQDPPFKRQLLQMGMLIGVIIAAIVFLVLISILYLFVSAI